MSRLGGTLFGLPFAAVGIAMLGWTAFSLWQVREIQSWLPVEATVIAGGYHVSAGEDGDTYKAWGEYRYTVGGREFVSERVAIDVGSDNIGSFQQDLGNRLRHAAANGRSVTAWVNPDDPADAVLDRSTRWGFQAFKLAFGLVFGTVGVAIIVGSWRVAAKADAAEEIRGKRTGGEWLANPDWLGEPIRSEARSASRIAWLFAGFWNLISVPVGFLAFDAFRTEGNAMALIGLLFPLVGLGLGVWAVRVSREWWRFGAAPVELDPFPGSIGGDVGGRIRLNTPVDPSQQFDVTLSLLRSSRTSDSRRESAKWQRTQRVRATGGRIEFRFEVPEGLAESDTETSGTYHLWRLHVRGDMSGPDFDRDYVIPVYATAARSERVRAIEAADDEQQRLDDEALERQLRGERRGLYGDIVFPAGRRLHIWLSGVVFGAIFAGAGVFLLDHDEAPWLMGVVFSTVGGLIALYGLYGVGRALRVSRDGSTILSRRTWLGIPLGVQRIDLTRVLHFRAQQTFSTQSGGRHAIYYALYLVDENGEARVGDGLRGLNEVEALVRYLTRRLQLPELALAQTPAKSARERLAER